MRLGFTHEMKHRATNSKGEELERNSERLGARSRPPFTHPGVRSASETRAHNIISPIACALIWEETWRTKPE